MANYHDGYLNQGAPIGAQVYDLTLIADNTLVDISACSVLRLYSDSATATARTFTLTSPSAGLCELIILFMSATNSCELLTAGNVKLQSTWTPLQYESISLQWDGTYWIELGRKKQSLSNLSDFAITSPADNNILYYESSTPAWQNVAVSGDLTNSSGAFTIANSAVTNAKVSASAAIDFSKLATLTSANILVGSSGNVATSVAVTGDITLSNAGVVALQPYFLVRSATVSLTSTQILALNATPVEIVAAQGAGKVIVPVMLEFLHTYSTAAYTNGGGGHVVFEWGDGTDCMVLNASRVTDNSSATLTITPSLMDLAASGTATGQAYDAMAGQNFRITKATAEFGGGNASNIVKLRLTYRVVTLLT